jgi:hypothetical protein
VGSIPTKRERVKGVSGPCVWVGTLRAEQCLWATVLLESTASFAGSPRCSNDQGGSEVHPSFRFGWVFRCDGDSEFEIQSKVRMPERDPVQVGNEHVGEMF